MDKMPKQIEFRDDGYFYNMASAFMVTLCGLKSIIDPSNPLNLKDDGTTVRLDGKVRPVFMCNVYSLHKNTIDGKINPSFIVSSLKTSLIIAAYEAVKDQNDESPLFEFFFHIRNAAAHNNKFYFYPHQPKRRAEWRGKIIDHTKKGNDNPLFGKVLFPNYMGPAAPLQLLWDVEQQLLGN